MKQLILCCNLSPTRFITYSRYFSRLTELKGFLVFHFYHNNQTEISNFTCLCFGRLAKIDLQKNNVCSSFAHYSSQLQHSLHLHNLRVATSLAIVLRKVIKQHGKNTKIPGTDSHSPDPCPHYTTPECEFSAKLVFPFSYACSFAQRVPKGQREELLPYMAQYQRCSFLLTGSTNLFCVEKKSK